ncbi:excalibur calcium-binding domain-containing protein [Nocardioides convexus]|uniref:thermonuclease family protein n=1 Tax=Nocardioides convexus TaxID=2712224 RepID=UPI002418AAF6|nr:excalibur calcium-binding domain-containing protein [Nocardioides convexus]
MQASARRLVAVVLGVLVVVAGIGLLVPQAGASPGRVVKDLDCGDFGSQASAQDYFLSIGGPYSDPDNLDSDGDGIACESLPCPCSDATGGGGGGGGTTTPPPPAAPTTLRTTARIISVIDGDTVLVRASGVKRRVRLIGVAAPALSPRQCGGPAATRLGTQDAPARHPRDPGVGPHPTAQGRQRPSPSLRDQGVERHRLRPGPARLGEGPAHSQAVQAGDPLPQRPGLGPGRAAWDLARLLISGRARRRPPPPPVRRREPSPGSPRLARRDPAQARRAR